jgi:hypothetical protein
MGTCPSGLGISMDRRWHDLLTRAPCSSASRDRTERSIGLMTGTACTTWRGLTRPSICGAMNRACTWTGVRWPPRINESDR